MALCGKETIAKNHANIQIKSKFASILCLQEIEVKDETCLPTIADSINFIAPEQ